MAKQMWVADDGRRYTTELEAHLADVAFWQAQVKVAESDLSEVTQAESDADMWRQKYKRAQKVRKERDAARSQSSVPDALTLVNSQPRGGSDAQA